MRSNRQGFILIVVLGILGTLASLGIMQSNTGNLTSKLAKTVLMHSKARLLARSGVEKGIQWTERRLGNDFLNPVKRVSFDISMGVSGSFRGNDTTKVSIQDANGCLNINDGIRAGMLELGDAYKANSLDPYPTWGVTDDSALINLRIRRTLNAYGDVWKFLAELDWPVWHIDDWESDSGNYGIQFDSTRTATFDHTVSIPPRGPAGPMSNPVDIAADSAALGDILIGARPSQGYASIQETEHLIESWAKRVLPPAFLAENDICELIKQDLVVTSWEDDSFHRLARAVAPHAGMVQIFAGITADNVAHLDNAFPDLSALWLPHSVAVINLNSASAHVRAAVFAALTNVEYSAEGVHADLIELPGFHKAPSPRPWISTIHTVLKKPRRENGVNHPLGTTNTLMSMRDALVMSQAYEEYLVRGNTIDSFDSFQVFLEWMQLGRDTRAVANERALRNPNVLKVDTNNMLWWPARTGHFTSDYIHKTLPHVLSCNRRIPSWLGAPLALTSPLCVRNFDSSRLKNYEGVCFISVEDFVVRHVHPKISFQSGGLFRIGAVSLIKDELLPVTASIQMTSRHFKTTVLRSQAEFLDHTVPSSSAATLRSSSDILIGPDSQTMDPNHWLGHVGLKDREEIPEGAFPLKFNANFDATLEPTPSSNFPRVSDTHPDNWLGTVGTGRSFSPPTGLTYPPDLTAPFDGALLQQIRQAPPAGQTFNFPSAADSAAVVMSFAAILHSATSVFVSPAPPMPSTLAEAMQFIIDYGSYMAFSYDVPPNDPNDPDNFAWLISRLPTQGGWNSWAKSWHNGGPPTASDGHSAMSGTNLEGPNVPFFAGDSSMRTDLHPFGGLWLGAGHGARAPQMFGDSLYFRPQDHVASNEPLGSLMSKGMLTFWVRIPTGLNGLVNRRSLFHATVWERVELANHDSVDPTHPTPAELDMYWRPVHLNCQLVPTNVTADGPLSHHQPKLTPSYAVTFIKSQSNVISHHGLPAPQYSNLRTPDPVNFPIGGNGLTGNYLGLAKSEIVDQPDWPTWFMRDLENDPRTPIGLVATADWVHMAPGSWVRIGLGWDFNELHESVNQRMWLRILSADDRSDHDQSTFTSCTQSIQDVAGNDLFPEIHDSIPLHDPMVSNYDRSIIQFGEMPLYLHHARSEKTADPNETPLSDTMPTGVIPTQRLYSSIDNICLRLGTDGGVFRTHGGLGLLEGTLDDHTQRYDIDNNNEPEWVVDPSWNPDDQLYDVTARIYDVPNLASFSKVHRSLLDSVNSPSVEISVRDASGLTMSPGWSSPADLYGDPVEFFSDTPSDWNDPRHGLPVMSNNFPRDTEALPGHSAETSLYHGMTLTGEERIVARWIAEDPHGNPLKGKLTDIPYVQELAWRVRPAGPVKIVSWKQD